MLYDPTCKYHLSHILLPTVVSPLHSALRVQVYHPSCCLARSRTILVSLWPCPMPHSRSPKSIRSFSILMLWRLYETYFLCSILHTLGSLGIVACYDCEWVTLRSFYFSFFFQSRLSKLGGFGVDIAPVYRLSCHSLSLC